MIRIRQFRVEDAEGMVLRPIFHSSSKEMFIKESYLGKSFSIYEVSTDLILACATLIKISAHAATLNMLMADCFVKVKKELIWVLRESIGHYMRELELSRVHATIRADFPNAEKWIKIVGFEKEGLMRCYGPDKEDHFLFAKVVI